MTVGEKIRQRRIELNMSQEELAKKAGYKSRSSINKIELGINDVTQSKVVAFAKALQTTTAYLMGWEDPNFDSPTITDDTTIFPVIGEIAAGYDKIALESWEGDTVEIPNSYLKGRDKEDFIVLRVKGDSMYPLYHEGDKVLILKQSTLNASGDIGAILYDDELITLKKIKYVMGEDWLRMVPINPNVPPTKIEGERLEHCRIIGIPKLLIRELNEL